MYSKPSSEHTPGPWVASTIQGDGNTLMVGGGSDGSDIVADIRIESANVEGNARLIAAAPALFAVLHRIVIDMNCCLDEDSYDPTASILEAEAVLRLITGRDEELIASLWERRGVQ